MARATQSKSKSKSKSIEPQADVPVETADEMDVDATGEGEEGEEEQGADADEGEGEVEGEGEGEGEDDEEEGEGEYEVEAILDHISAAGKFRYLVAWKGYGEEHNTWEPQAHVDHAEEIVKRYWANKPKKPVKAEPPATGKRGRPSTSKPAASPPAKASRTANGRAKRKSPPSEDDDEVPPEESHPDDMSKYQDVEDWEDLVVSVDTIERGPDETLLVFMTMTGGEKGAMPTEVVYKRCPQKILAFYEAHLKWKT